MATDSSTTDLVTKLDSKITDLETRLTSAEKTIAAFKAVAPLSAGEKLDLIKTAYVDAGNWARHFSTVRMTVTPFLIGISLGVTVFAVEHHNRALLALACGVWVLMVVLMFAFTKYMRTRWHHQQIDSQRMGLDELLPREKPPRPIFGSVLDLAMLVTLLLTALFIYAQRSFWCDPGLSGPTQAPAPGSASGVSNTLNVQQQVPPKK